MQVPNWIIDRLLLQIEMNSRLNICEDHCINTNIKLMSLNSGLETIYNQWIGNIVPKIDKTMPNLTIYW